MLEYLLNGRTRALSDVTDGRVGPSVAVTTLPLRERDTFERERDGMIQ
jgi:hypothetical protein